MKKIFIAAIALMLIMSLVTPGEASAADDLTGHKYEEQVRKLMELGVIQGDDKGKIEPDRDVTRAEFVKMVVEAFEIGKAAEGAALSFSSASNQLDFKDLKAGAWYIGPITAAVEAGITTGYPGNLFKPSEKITRQEMASMVSRALTAKGINVKAEDTAELSFSDSNSIHPAHRDNVRILTHHGIMNGNTDNTFKPLDNSKRWMVALVMLKGRDEVFPPQNLPFQASTVLTDSTKVVRQFETFAQAKQYVQSTNNVHAVEANNKVIWMQSGIVATNAFTEVYHTQNFQWAPGGQFRPYVSSNTEMKYLDSTDQFVKVELAGKTGYVKPENVVLIPDGMKKGQSYYRVANGNLEHILYNHFTGAYVSTGAIGKAPAGLSQGVEYFSWDGANFTTKNGQKVTESHQYFNKLPLHTVSNYTAAELDKYLNDKFPYYNQTAYGKRWTTSPLVGSGRFFKEMEQKYKINALYLMSHAIHESAWGTSKIAQDKNNLFGYGAVDSDPYRGAYTYATFRESIEDAAQRVNQNYQTVTGSFYNGSILGNKAAGMNVRYASDAYWGEKIAGHMYRADVHLGSKDINKKTLGITTTDGLNFRSGAGTSHSSLYKLNENIPVVINGSQSVSGVNWHRVQSENKLYAEAFVSGQYIRMLPVAK
ncbi:S-layer homology domain-containing protein [Jeotgalibacillus proteolyticus]|uniref:S-layer protein n=1 Tax=Jeotgalibacillus proteolyticus TaxID=2082395 RepID=A0A2S5GBB2_9BACL|nr:S-layer homology domain-containing protein [Jeotgalibacillus proteolyticus]PPA70279.1 S-layer protein [Jeotgalibacillus proteolyticus]